MDIKFETLFNIIDNSFSHIVYAMLAEKKYFGTPNDQQLIYSIITNVLTHLQNHTDAQMSVYTFNRNVIVDKYTIYVYIYIP